MTLLTQFRPLPELYAEAAEAIDRALPALMEIVDAHPVPTCFLVAHVQGLICSMRQRSAWLRNLVENSQRTGDAS